MFVAPVEQAKFVVVAAVEPLGIEVAAVRMSGSEGSENLDGVVSSATLESQRLPAKSLGKGYPNQR